MPEFYTWTILLINQLGEIGEKRLSFLPLKAHTPLSIEANRVDSHQTAPIGAYRSSLIWVYTVCHRGFLNISADKKSRRLLLRLAL